MGCLIYIEKELSTVTCKLSVYLRVHFLFFPFFAHTAFTHVSSHSYHIYLGRSKQNSKPANVLLQGDVPSGNYKAQLADFGVAAMTQNRDEDEDLTSETETYR